MAKMEQYVIFKSHQQLFAIEIQHVVRVVEASTFTPLPEVADFVLGVQSIESAMVPIIDARKKLFHSFTADSGQNVILLCQWKDKSIGLYVEEIVGIQPLSETENQQDLAVTGLKQDYVTAFLQKEDALVLALDLDFLFSYEEEAALLAGINTYRDDDDGANADDE